MKKKKIMIILTFLISIVFLTENIYAKTYTTTEQYRVRRCDSHSAADCSFTSWTNNGTNTSINTSNYIVDGLSMHFGTNDIFYKGTTYRVIANYDITGSIVDSTNPYYYKCFGGVNNSTSNIDENNIETCTLVGTIRTENNISYIYDVTPIIDIKTIHVNFYFATQSWSGVKGNATKSEVSQDTTTSDAINNSTTNIITNNNQNTNDIINNQNSNTDKINNSINEQLGNRCTNLIELPYNNNNIYSITAAYNDYWTFVGNDFILENGKTYYYSFDSNYNHGYEPGTSTIEVLITKDRQFNTYIALTSKKGTFTVPLSGTYALRLDCNKQGDTCTFSNFMISEKTSNYCKYGTYTSKIDQTNEILNQDYTFEKPQGELQGEDKIDQAIEKEEELMQGLDLESEIPEVIINPNTASFIWNIVEGLRGMSTKIITLMTSILSLGIFKMILNR